MRSAGSVAQIDGLGPANERENATDVAVVGGRPAVCPAVSSLIIQNAHGEKLSFFVVALGGKPLSI